MEKEIKDSIETVQEALSDFEEKGGEIHYALNALERIGDEVILKEDEISQQDDKISDLKKELDDTQDELERLKETHGLT